MHVVVEIICKIFCCICSLLSLEQFMFRKIFKFFSSLNYYHRQAQELTERTSPDQAAKIKGPLAQVNRRWDELLKGIVERQRELENALLRLGQFQHALQELMAWIEKTNRSLDSLKPVFGDPQIIEVELAKLKVCMIKTTFDMFPMA